MLARFQATITDNQGNVIPSPFIEVRSEQAGAPLATIYSDRDGTLLLGNPFQVSTEDGFAAFHVAGGAYKIRAYTSGFEKIWRYVAIGTNAERDFGTVFNPRGEWDIATTYEQGDMVSLDGGAGPYSFVSNIDDNLGNSPQFDSSGVAISDANWTVVGLLESPGTPGADGAPGSSDVVGTSTSSVAIGTGAKTFTIVENDRGWGVGARLRLSSDADPTTHWMEGVVTAYSGNTLDIAIDLVAGSGSRADWTINLAGEQGEPGAAGGNLTIYSESTGTNTILASAQASWTRHVFKAGVTNTGAATFNGDPLLNAAGGALRAGEIQAGTWYDLIHDGVNYYLIMSGAVR